MIGLKVKLKVDKLDVTAAQGVNGMYFEVGRAGGCRAASVVAVY
jgi:hypothetical protein